MPADEDELRVRCVVFRPVRAGRMTMWTYRRLTGPPLGILPRQRFELFHRMIRFVLGNKIYVGPVEKVLSPDRDTGGERLRVLDMGTGGGLW